VDCASAFARSTREVFAVSSIDITQSAERYAQDGYYFPVRIMTTGEAAS